MLTSRPSRYRLVERYLVHEGRAPLAERIDAVIPADAHYVVFDLDRTIHLGVTIGERLGWEITANPGAAPPAAAKAMTPRSSGRSSA